MIRRWLARRPPGPVVDPTVLIGSHVDYLEGRVAGLKKLVAELERDVAVRDRRIAELQHALAPYAKQELMRIGLQHYLQQGRQVAERLDGPTAVMRPQGRHALAAPTEQWRRT